MQYQDLGDYIGAESCLDFSTDAAEIASRGRAGMGRPRCQRRSHATEKAYPPAMPSLVMRKYSTSDGRLVIKEEKVERHQYFQAQRSNGRLRLNFIPPDGSPAVAGDGEENRFEFTERNVEQINGGDEGMNGPVMDEARSESNKYNGMGVNPCGGYVAAVEFPPPLLT